MNTQLNLNLSSGKSRPTRASDESARWWFVQIRKTVRETADKPVPPAQTQRRIRAYPEVVIAKAMAQNRLSSN